MKKFVLVFGLLMAATTYASQSSEDIQSILSDKNVQAVIGASEISSITTNNQRHYTIVFGTCAAEVGVTSICAPMPGGPCANEVVFNSASVNCLP